MALPESPSAIKRWLLGFVPSQVTVRWPERSLSCLGALLGIAFTGGLMHFLFGPSAVIPLLLAPMGASAVLLFAAPASPLAQPWSIIGGNIVSAFVGVVCARWIANPVDAAALAVSLSICAMFALRCVHPPSGAVALTAVLGGPAIHSLSYSFVLAPVALQSFALLSAALVFHAITGHRYPHTGAQRTAQSEISLSGMRPSFTQDDIDVVLKRRGEWLDIEPTDLEALLRETQWQAYVRMFGEPSGADIMSRRLSERARVHLGKSTP